MYGLPPFSMAGVRKNGAWVRYGSGVIRELGCLRCLSGCLLPYSGGLRAKMLSACRRQFVEIRLSYFVVDVVFIVLISWPLVVAFTLVYGKFIWRQLHSLEFSSDGDMESDSTYKHYQITSCTKTTLFGSLMCEEHTATCQKGSMPSPGSSRLRESQHVSSLSCSKAFSRVQSFTTNTHNNQKDGMIQSNLTFRS